MCIVLMMSIVFTITNYLHINIHAEENIEETEITEFETLEKQILNSERWCSAGNDESDVSLDIENMWFLPNDDEEYL